MLVQLSVNALPERLEAIMTALEEVQGAQVAALVREMRQGWVLAYSGSLVRSEFRTLLLMPLRRSPLLHSRVSQRRPGGHALT